MLKDSGLELESLLHPSNRKTFMDGMGELGELIESAHTRDFPAKRTARKRRNCSNFSAMALDYLDHSLAQNRRVTVCIIPTT